MKKYLIIIPVIAVLLIGIGGFYSVPTDSSAVVLNFGRFSKIAEPGLHWRMPFITEQFTLPSKRQLTMEFGFATRDATDPNQPSSEPLLDSNMVTGDLNAVTIRYVAQYTISDAQAAVLNNTDPVSTLRNLGETVMRQVVGDRGVDEVLTVGRKDTEDTAQVLLQQAADKIGLGITIDQLQVSSVDPPGSVKNSFNEVNKAQQEKVQTINRAQSLYNQEVPKAKGLADRMLSNAEGYRAETVNRAKGEVARFLSVFDEYKKAPEITTERLYLETMAKVLASTESYVVEDGDSSPLPLLYMQGNTNAKIPAKSNVPTKQGFDRPSQTLREPDAAQQTRSNNRGR